VLTKLVERGPDGFEGGLTRRKYVAMTGAGEATAARDLAALVAAGVLVARGRGRSVVYEIREPE
jgi:Fic family protein